MCIFIYLFVLSALFFYPPFLSIDLFTDSEQVFNPPAALAVPSYYIDLWRLQDYGKFSQSNYSYLIWEPSDQQPILDISGASNL